MNVTFGYAWRRHCNVEACIRSEVARFLADCSHIGKRVKFSSLPNDVKQYAKQAL